MAKRLHVVKYMVEATEEWSECKQYDTLTVGRVFDRHTNATLSPDPFMEGVATGILAGRCIVSTGVGQGVGGVNK